MFCLFSGESASSTYPTSRDEASDAAAGTCPHRHRWALSNFSWGVTVRRDVRRQRFASTAAVRRARKEHGRHSFTCPSVTYPHVVVGIDATHGPVVAQIRLFSAVKDGGVSGLQSDSATGSPLEHAISGLDDRERTEDCVSVDDGTARAGTEGGISRAEACDLYSPFWYLHGGHTVFMH